MGYFNSKLKVGEYYKYFPTFSKFLAHNVNIIVVKDVNNEKTVQEELVEDMMSLIASFSGKLYGMRSKSNRSKKGKDNNNNEES